MSSGNAPIPARPEPARGDQAAPELGQLPPAERMRVLLAREREAATRADSEALVALQPAKLAALAAIPADDPAREELAELARDNLMLLRHLQRCYEAALGVTPTYGPAGKKVQTPTGTTRIVT